MPTYAQIAGISNESLMDGSVEREIEYTIYARITDLDAIRKAAIETHRHEQWLVPVKQENVDGKMRIRLIDDSRPTLCTKIKREGVVGSEEVEMDISMDMYKSIREMSVGGYIKTRYTVPSTVLGLNWEIDVFLTRGGAQHEWVKVDLEVNDINRPIPAFPFETSRFIVDVGELGYTDRTQIKKLWEEEWLKMEVTQLKAK